MRLAISPKAEKELRKFHKIDQIAVAKKIRSLNDPPTLVKREKLSGYVKFFRIRVGQYRIVYRQTRNEIFIVLIGHRKDI